MRYISHACLMCKGAPQGPSSGGGVQLILNNGRGAVCTVASSGAGLTPSFGGVGYCVYIVLASCLTGSRHEPAKQLA